MDTDIDLSVMPREDLLALIAQLQAVVQEQQTVIAQSQRRIEILEGKARPGGPKGMPGIKPKSGRHRTPREKGPRKPRPHGFARRRMTPTHRVEHALESCPQCGTGLSGGWAQRTREGIDIPAVPAQVTEHVFIARTCPVCERRRIPRADLGGVVLGQQRLGVNLLSLIAALREKGRLPWRTIRWHLKTVHQLDLSLGAIVGAVHQVAQKAQPAVTEIRDRIRASPVVHADETGWREDGVNGYVWTFSTPTERYFLRRGRNKEVVDEALGDSFDGVLVSDFYAAYHHYPGLKQRCWVHLLRGIHDLKVLYPQTRNWPGGRRQSSKSTLPPRPSTIPRPGNAGGSNNGWNGNCWTFAAPTSRTRRRSRASCAGAWRSTSRNCLSSWQSPACQRRTTPRNGACGLWWSAVKSAAAPARNRAPPPR